MYEAGHHNPGQHWIHQKSDVMPHYYQDERLAQHLRAFLGEIDPAAMELLRRHLEWVEIAAGETLMTQGDAGDSMYLSISGRLRAYVVDDDGVEYMMREMARGQVIGEMSLYTDEPRSATVVAIRDSVLVRLAKSEFNSLLASSSQVSIALTRQIIKRLQTAQSHSNLVKSILASTAIPGALPPVLHEGDLLCDGGTFNNFPANVMRDMRGVGKVIGVDLSLRKRRRAEQDEVPGNWALRRDRLRPHNKRRYKFPSLVSYLMNVTILYSNSRHHRRAGPCTRCRRAVGSERGRDQPLYTVADQSPGPHGLPHIASGHIHRN